MNGVAKYFDERAKNWDSTENRAQGAVLSFVDIKEGDSVLDLGCGQGIMVPFYLDANVSHVTAVDISPKMIEFAKQKFASVDCIEFIACDALDLDESNLFDAVVIYNAYPHFMDKHALVDKIWNLLKPNGRFVVAHGSGKELINSHHQAVAAGVSSGLAPVEEESRIWKSKFKLEALVDTPGIYAFSGVKK